MDNSVSEFPESFSTQVIPDGIEPNNPGYKLKAVLTCVIGLLLFTTGFIGYYLGKNADSAQAPQSEIVAPTFEPEGTICTLDAMICPDGSAVGRTGPNCEFEECPTSDIGGKSIYEGRLNPFTLSYPSTYAAEHADVKDGTKVIEQVIFKNPSSPNVDEFVIRVDQNVAQLPVYPYDYPPTGEYELDGTKGIYLELPQGYGDGGMWKPRPTTHLFFINNNREYQFTFFGVSDIKDVELQKILKGFRFSK